MNYDLVILRFDYQDDFLVVFVLCPCGYNGVSSLKISDAKLAMRALHRDIDYFDIILYFLTYGFIYTHNHVYHIKSFRTICCTMHFVGK